MVLANRLKQWIVTVVLAVFVMPAAVGALAAEPKRVLLLHSFGRDVAPYAGIASVFRSELARGWNEPIAVYEASLDAVHTMSAQDDATFAELLRHRFANSTLDLIVAFGPPAARFLTRNREYIFPGTPMLMAAVDERILRTLSLRAGDAAVLGKVDLPREVDTMLQLLPETSTVAVVVGSSPLERFWVGEMQKEFAQFADRLKFVWFDSLTFEQIRKQVASLPPHSVVFYTLFAVDAAGIPFEGENALVSLHEVSTAPIFGLYENELGKGVVGGPYSSQRKRGELAAAAARRILTGNASAAPAVSTIGLEPPVYDWRELKRWGIAEAALPAGSEVRFRPLSLWDQHRTLIVVALSIFVLQTGLMVALLRQRIRRRRAEEEAHALSGRLIDKHEDERRWIARELHDDITQRLAGLSIDVAKLSGNGLPASDLEARRSVRGALARLSEDVHGLSYRLHPSVLDDLGLVDALKAECDRVAQSDAVHVDVAAETLPLNLPREVGLCIYRVAQEALRNVVRHAKASSAQLSLALSDGGVRLAVTDDGKGFEPGGPRPRPSLGHASMRERLRLLGGKLEIKSSPGQGTTVIAWVPIPEIPS